MATENEFIVKNGLDVKNSVVKLNGVSGTANQFAAQNSGGNALEWKTISPGSGLKFAHSVGSLVIETTGALPATTTAVGNLIVGVDGTWASNGTTTVTVTFENHGLTTGNSIDLAWYGGVARPANGAFIITVLTTSTFTITAGASVTTTSGTCLIGGITVSKRVLTVGESNADVSAALSVKAVDSNISSLLNLKNSSNTSVASIDTAGAMIIGNVTGGTYNKVTITQPATSATLTIANGKTLTVSNTITLTAGADGQSFALPATSGTLPLNNQTFFLGTQAIAINQGSGTLTLPNASLTNSSVTIGSTVVSLGPTAVTSFTGLVGLSSAAAAALSVTSGTTGVLTLDSGTTGAVNIGTNANAKTITIGNVTGATGVVLNAGTAAVTIPASTASTTSGTGALVVTGGVGIGGAVNIAGAIGVTGNATTGANITLNHVGNAISINGGAGATTANVFNTVSTTVNAFGAATAVAIGAGSSTVTFGNLISHKGVTLTVGTNVDQTSTFTHTGALSTTWVPTSLTGTSLGTGVYQFKMQVGATNEWYMGILPWYSGNGAGSIADDFTEIPMYKVSDGAVGSSIYVRILRAALAAPVLQLSATTSLVSASYNFTFRKILS